MDGMEQQPRVTSAAVKKVFSIDSKRAEVLIQLVKSSDQDVKEGVVKAGHQKVSYPPDSSAARKYYHTSRHTFKEALATALWAHNQHANTLVFALMASQGFV